MRPKALVTGVTLMATIAGYSFWLNQPDRAVATASLTAPLFSSLIAPPSHLGVSASGGMFMTNRPSGLPANRPYWLRTKQPSWKAFTPMANSSQTNQLPAGVFQTVPFACLVIVPGKQPDDRCIVAPGNVDPQMPIAFPGLQLLPYHSR